MSSDVSEVVVASLRRHRLIVTVAEDGTADVQSNLHPREAAYVLRQLVARYEAAAPEAAGKDIPAGDEFTRAVSTLPAVGDRYDSRQGGDSVTVSRLWSLANGHIAVAFSWDNFSGSALPLESFNRAYQPAEVGPVCSGGAAIGHDETGVCHHVGAADEKLPPFAAASELTVYQASYDSIVMGLYTTREAARARCEAYVRRESGDVPTRWISDDDGSTPEDSVEELCIGEDRAGRYDRLPTGYVVTPLTVASTYEGEAGE